MDPKLDLQKAINTMHQSEAVEMQQATIRGGAITTDEAIDALHKTRHLQKGKGYKVSCKQSKNTCSRCSKSPTYHRHIPDSNVQQETLPVTVVPRKDTLNQCAGLKVLLIFQTITQTLPRAPESYPSLTLFRSCCSK